MVPTEDLKALNGNGKVRVRAKLEGSHPGGSVKHRAALFMILKAEESGELTKDKTLLEPSSCITCSRRVSPGMSSVQCFFRWRVAMMRSRIDAELSPSMPERSSRYSTAGTSTWMSMRSSSGPEIFDK